jgi:hypothetical protein
MHKRYLLGSYRLFFGLLGLAAVIVQLSHQIPKGSYVLTNFFSFFTIESNIMAFCLLVGTGLLTLRNKSTDSLVGVRGAITLYMVITGIIYTLLLSGLQQSLQTTIPWVNTVVHYILPVVVLLDWLVDKPRITLPFKRALLWILFPVAYLVYSLIRGHATGWYPYPFLNVGQHGYLQVVVTSAIIAVFGIGLTALLVWTSRLRHI